MRFGRGNWRRSKDQEQKHHPPVREVAEAIAFWLKSLLVLWQVRFDDNVLAARKLCAYLSNRTRKILHLHMVWKSDWNAAGPYQRPSEKIPPSHGSVTSVTGYVQRVKEHGISVAAHPNALPPWAKCPRTS